MNLALQKNEVNDHNNMISSTLTNRWDYAIGFRCRVCRKSYKNLRSFLTFHRD
jgi:hypothetical protein